MAREYEVDGSIFAFPEGWMVEKLDEWPEQTRLTPDPFNSKGCDLVALQADTLWLVEAKDYTYPGARVPADLARQVSIKVFHSLAVLHAAARWGDGQNKTFSAKALTVREARVCLAVELPDGGRKLQEVATPLAALLTELKKAIKPLGVHRPLVSNSHLLNGVPWVVRRDPGTRSRHLDR